MFGMIRYGVPVFRDFILLYFDARCNIKCIAYAQLNYQATRSMDAKVLSTIFTIIIFSLRFFFWKKKFHLVCFLCNFCEHCTHVFSVKSSCILEPMKYTEFLSYIHFFPFHAILLKLDFTLLPKPFVWLFRKYFCEYAEWKTIHCEYT